MCSVFLPTAFHPIAANPSTVPCLPLITVWHSWKQFNNYTFAWQRPPVWIFRLQNDFPLLSSSLALQAFNLGLIVLSLQWRAQASSARKSRNVTFCIWKFCSHCLFIPDMRYDVLPPVNAYFSGPELVLCHLQILHECHQQPGIFFTVCQHNLLKDMLMFLVVILSVSVLSAGLQMLENHVSCVSNIHENNAELCGLYASVRGDRDWKVPCGFVGFFKNAWKRWNVEDLTRWRKLHVGNLIHSSQKSLVQSLLSQKTV